MSKRSIVFCSSFAIEALIILPSFLTGIGILVKLTDKIDWYRLTGQRPLLYLITHHYYLINIGVYVWVSRNIQRLSCAHNSGFGCHDNVIPCSTVTMVSSLGPP